MMNKELFAAVPRAFNSEGAPAYAFTAEHALAQYASTGCFTQTFYASAEMQLATVMALVSAVDPVMVAKTALWTRRESHMKDLPAFLVAYLTVAAPELAEKIFDRVIDDTKMLRNFVQVVRSGVVARRSLASMPKRLVKSWLASRTPEQLFKGSVGAEPSLGDVIKMAHPRPENAERSALYAYLTGRAYDASALPALVKAYLAWVAAPKGPPPAVSMQLLTAMNPSDAQWKEIARNASWTELRMNLNTFARHGAFSSRTVVDKVAKKLRDKVAIRRSRVLPYQLMMAWKAVDGAVPGVLKDALEDAMDVALENVPTIEGRVYLCPDVSGSMSQPVTGHRKGATSAVRCIDVAGLVAAAMMRVNDAVVIPFEQDVVDVKISKNASVMSNARKLASIGGGGTNCSAPLAKLNREDARGELVVLISDNESWVDARPNATGLMVEWEAFRRRNPRAKLVCIDLVPNRTTQALDRTDVMNVGGFSDAVFELLGEFASARSPDHWVRTIRREVI